MLRFVLAILLAPVFFGLLSVPSSMLVTVFFPAAADGSPQSLGYLLSSLVISPAYSVFAGFCSAWTAGTTDRPIGLAAGLSLLAVGIAVQVSFWETVPVWYHLVFLGLIVPFAMLGSRLRSS